MSFSSGPNTVNDSVVFAFDIGDTTNSYKGQPITNQQTVLGTSGFGPSADNGVSYPINGTGTFVRLGYGQTFGGYTIQPSDVVYRYDLGSNGCHYHGFDTAIPGGTYATFTFDYLVANATNYPSTNFLANFEIAFGGGAGAPNSLQNVWQTVSFTGGPTGGASTLRSLLYPGGCGGRLADSGYILYKNPQVTYTPYSVPFTQGTRSTTQGLLDISGKGNTIDLVNMTYGANNAISFDGTDDYNGAGNLGNINDFTVEIVFKSDSVTNYRNPIDCNWLVYSPSYSNIGPRLEQNSSGNLSWVVGDSVGNYTGVNVVSSGLNGALYHYASITRVGSYFVAYYNGAQSGTAVFNNWYGAFSNLNIGRGFSTSSERWFIGKIPIVKVYNRALTPNEIQNNYLQYKTRFNLS